MVLEYDPGDGPAFWQAVEKLPGYPADEHTPIPRMLFASDAIFKLPEILNQAGGNPHNPVLVVMDETPMMRRGKNLKQSVMEILSAQGWHAKQVVMRPDASGQVHTDMPHIGAVRAEIREGMSLLAVGSGTVCDITKHAGYLNAKEAGERVPFVVFQTANSVSAFTSNMAPTFVEGIKRTLASRYPDALVCDLETLADAPYEMTVAGVGDLLAAFVSLPDWHLASQLGMDPTYNEFAQRLMGPLDHLFLSWARRIHDRTPESMSVLAKLIALGGLAMSLSHATTPMSGYEHVMSHILDLLAETAHQPVAQHGTQVALTTVLAAGAYQSFLDEFDPNEVNTAACYPAPGQMEKNIRATFLSVDPSGKAGEECWADYRLKLQAWHAQRDVFDKFRGRWGEVKAQLKDMSRTPARLLEILRVVNSPVTFKELTPPVSEAEARFAFMNAPLMRKRLTLGDLLIFLNWDRDRLWQQVWENSQRSTLESVS